MCVLLAASVLLKYFYFVFNGLWSMVPSDHQIQTFSSKKHWNLPNLHFHDIICINSAFLAECLQNLEKFSFRLTNICWVHVMMVYEFGGVVKYNLYTFLLRWSRTWNLNSEGQVKISYVGNICILWQREHHENTWDWQITSV